MNYDELESAIGPGLWEAMSLHIEWRMKEHDLAGSLPPQKLDLHLVGLVYDKAPQVCFSYDVARGSKEHPSKTIPAAPDANLNYFGPLALDNLIFKGSEVVDAARVALIEFPSDAQILGEVDLDESTREACGAALRQYCILLALAKVGLQTVINSAILGFRVTNGFKVTVSDDDTTPIGQSWPLSLKPFPVKNLETRREIVESVCASDEARTNLLGLMKVADQNLDRELVHTVLGIEYPDW